MTCPQGSYVNCNQNLHTAVFFSPCPHLCTLIGSNFFQDPVGENAGVHGPAEDRKEKVPSPHLSQLVVLTNSGSLYGLAQRVVATESL